MARKRRNPKKVIKPVLPKIRGKSYKVIEVWHSVQHPDGPPVVIVRVQDQQS